MANKQKSAYLVAQSKKSSKRTTVMNKKGMKMPVHNMSLKRTKC